MDYAGKKVDIGSGRNGDKEIARNYLAAVALWPFKP
jgi:hypothetical protein